MYLTNRRDREALEDTRTLRREPTPVLTAGTSGLIERDAVLTTLDRLLRESAAGKGRLAVVDGPMGVGRSAVLHAFLEAAADAGALTLSAIASHAERTLPFGVLSQLLATTRIPAPLRQEIRAHLDATTARACAEGPDPEVGPDPEAVPAAGIQDAHRLSRTLADLAETAPLVLAVDNLHQTDTPSLRFLSVVVPRLTSARVLVVLTDDAGAAPGHAPLRSELFLRPNVTRINLDPLTERGVARLIARQLGEAAADHLTAEFTAISGGNPLVLRCLVLDHRSGAGRHPQEYAHVLMRRLRQGGPAELPVARALAVLGDTATPDRLARLAGVHGDDAVRTLDGLTTAGLLDHAAFRHPAAASLVLDDLPAPDRSDLRRRAAELLHDEGAPPTRVAEQLVEAGGARPPWAADVLVAAADEALLDDRVRDAADQLGLAERLGPDTASRASVRSQLSRLEWQLKPPAADVRLAPLVDDVALGDLATDETTDLLWRLSWYGQVHEVSDVLAALRDTPRGQEQAPPDTAAIATWLTCTYPLYAGTRRPTRPVPVTSTGTTVRSGRWVSSAGALADGLIGGRTDELADTALTVLHSLRLDHGSLWSGECGLLALLSLIYAERLDTAAGRSDQLLAEADTRGFPAWRAVFTAVRAEIALRRGELALAYEEAERALALVPAPGWGVAVGLPLSCLVLAAVHMGRFDLAERHMAQAVPDALLQSRYGLHYLHARGHHRLATGQPRAALADFLSCGDLTAGWGMAGADMVPWRAGAAEAWLQLGNDDQARRLVRDQLARLPPGNSRARGLALRMLAAVSGITQRPRLLADAVEALGHSDDSFELARALTDLSSAHRQVGDWRNARRTAHRAWHLAKRCGAEPLYRKTVPGGERAFDPSMPDRAPGAQAALTEQQRRVASLAAEGYTNGEIAERLFITASTVEQHLTRVFRKLSVTRRQELPRRLSAQGTTPYDGVPRRAGR